MLMKNPHIKAKNRGLLYVKLAEKRCDPVWASRKVPAATKRAANAIRVMAKLTLPKKWNVFFIGFMECHLLIENYGRN